MQDAKVAKQRSQSPLVGSQAETFAMRNHIVQISGKYFIIAHSPVYM